MRAAILLSAIAVSPLLGATAALAHDQREPLSIEDVIARHHELDGRTIEVRGWLSNCQRLSCRLMARTDGTGTAYLSIGGSRAFDARVRGRAGQRITIRARLDARCMHARADSQRDEPEIVICTDRASELRNPVLVERHH